MECYIVRIYRRDPDNAHKIAGQVEIVGKEKKMVFGNIGELWLILNLDAVSQSFRSEEEA